MRACDGLGLPAATQRFVDGHYAAIQLNLGLGLAVFSRQTLALGVEQDQKVHCAFAVADSSQISGSSAGFALTNQRHQTLLAFAVITKSVF